MAVAGADFALAWDSLFAFHAGESLLNSFLKERSVILYLKIVLTYIFFVSPAAKINLIGLCEKIL